MKIPTHNLGFPRIGPRRELKRALEAYWAGKSTQSELEAAARAIRQQNWRLQQSLGIDLIPSNDFSLYDHVLDTCALVGAVPQRFKWDGGSVDLNTYFAMARGTNGEAKSQGQPITALEMTKWFDTNYHYLVPEISPRQTFRLASTKPVDEFKEAKAMGIETVPVLLGPLSFLLLGKVCGATEQKFSPFLHLPALLSVYEQLLEQLTEAGARWVQFDEPVLALDLPDESLAYLEPAYARLKTATGSSKLMLATYFGHLGKNLSAVLRSPVDAIHIDAVRAPQQVEKVLAALRPAVALSVGVVDGRNIWRNDFTSSLKLLHRALKELGPDRVIVSPSCSLLHVPLDLQSETQIDPELKNWLAFAEEKLKEVVTLARLFEGSADTAALVENRVIIEGRRRSQHIQDASVQARCEAVSVADARRHGSLAKRTQAQASALCLPQLPTTTIGSFPQTEAVRQARAKFRNGESTRAEYERFIAGEIENCIRKQEELGLDVLVHGEFERNDMVEYFGEQLSGFAFTQNGWVQSYGSRCVKPPILFGDVRRTKPMTVRWAEFAQNLTDKPVKGMLTGPLTLLQWSFVRDDQPRSATARQIALAIRDEVLDLEAHGIRIIQIDEPALREGMPLRREDRPEYVEWATTAFRLAAGGVKDTTQIHTHMCYSDFTDILDAIVALDVDVISFETSRSRMDLLQAFADFHYPAAVGPGIWDIHSPRVPPAREMVQHLQAALRVIPRERLWVNPDCGLKTRRWEEVVPALEHLVSAAKTLRQAPLTPGGPPISIMQTNHRTNSNMKSTNNTNEGHACCGSHADLSSSGTETSRELLQQGVLDVRTLPPARRHSLIFETYDGLRPGGSFVLVNDHDPKPLYYQFAYEKAGAFSWNYEEQGPVVWRVRIGKTDVQATLKSPAPAAH